MLAIKQSPHLLTKRHRDLLYNKYNDFYSRNWLMNPAGLNWSVRINKSNAK